MKIAKPEFIKNLRSLMEEREIVDKDIYERTSIGRSRWNSIMDPDGDIYPGLDQCLELCELFETTLYYFTFRLGPRMATERQIEIMTEIMDAHQDPSRPDIAVIISQLVKTYDYQTLLIIRKVVDQIGEARAKFTGDDLLEKSLIYAPEAMK